MVATALAISQWRRVGALLARSHEVDAAAATLTVRLSSREGVSTASRRPGLGREGGADGHRGPAAHDRLPTRRRARSSASQQEMAVCHGCSASATAACGSASCPRWPNHLFFHPLAQLAARGYVLAHEAACDARILRVLDAEPCGSGPLLVRSRVTPLPGDVTASGAAVRFESQTEDRHARPWFTKWPGSSGRIGSWLPPAVAALMPLTLVERPQRPRRRRTSRPARRERRTDTRVEPGAPRLPSSSARRRARSGRADFDDRRLELRHDGAERVLSFRRTARPMRSRLLRHRTAPTNGRPMADIGHRAGEIGAKRAHRRPARSDWRPPGRGRRAPGRRDARQGELGARQGALFMRERPGLTQAERELIVQERLKIDREMEELNARIAALDKEIERRRRVDSQLNGEMDELSQEMEHAKPQDERDLREGRRRDADAGGQADRARHGQADRLSSPVLQQRVQRGQGTGTGGQEIRR